MASADVPSVDASADNYTIEELRQYLCPLTLDTDTASVDVQVSDGDKRACHSFKNLKPPKKNPKRFQRHSQVMCREGLTGRNFCQVEWFGRYATIGMAYKDRKCKYLADCLGYSKSSWAIFVIEPGTTTAVHDGVKTELLKYSPMRVGLYLDWSAGTLSFYDITNDEAKIIHTFSAKFTEPLYLVFSMSAGIDLLPRNPGPVCDHCHDSWDMLRGLRDCKGCNGALAE